MREGSGSLTSSSAVLQPGDPAAAVWSDRLVWRHLCSEMSLGFHFSCLPVLMNPD